MVENNSTQLLEGPAAQVHREHGAKFAAFGGWNMPVSYAGTVAEHHAVRSSVGLFDVSHLGKAYVQGDGALDFINTIFTNDLQKITPGKAQYTLCTNESGGVIDDLIVYYESPESLFLVPNAANTADVVALLQEKARQAGIDLVIENKHRDYAIYALQGPQSAQVLSDLGLNPEFDYMAYRDETLQTATGECTVRVCRTGYTGERGYEIIPAWEDAVEVLRTLIAAIEPYEGKLAGLGARDTLRTEMGYALHGHELSVDITPVQAAVGWAVGWKKSDFLGKQQLEREKEQGPHRLLRALVMQERGIPRADYEVRDSQDTVIGQVTSGTFSPTLQKGIALALVSTENSLQEGDEVFINIRGKNVPAQVTSLPFVPSHVR